MFDSFCCLKKIFIIAVTLAYVFMSKVSLFATEKSIDNLQNEIEAIDLQIKFLKIKVDDQKKKTKSIENKIEDTKQQLISLSSQIEQLNKNQEDIIKQIQSLEKDNKESVEQQKELLARFKDRLVHLHKIRQGTLISSVLLAKNLNSFLNRYQMVKYLLETDRVLIEELKEKNEKINRISLALKEKQKALDSGKQEIAEKQKKYAKEQASLKLMLNTVLLEKNQFLKKEKSLASSRKQLEKQIQEATKMASKPEFEKELGISEDSVAVKGNSLKSVSAVPAESLNNNNANQKISTSNSNNKTTKSDTEKKEISSTSEAAKIMNFMWPIKKELREKVTEKGDENSSAILIKPFADAEVVAAAKGKVSYKGYINGLGEVIILSHQRGFTSVYAKLNDVWVGLNEVVDKGEVIGKIEAGSNEALHFEIRFGGKKQSPLSFLP